MKNKKKINYICEVNYPTSSAYSIHVLKMCDALAQKHIVNLYVPFSESSVNKLKENYLLKNNINIIKIFNKKKKLNFLNRIFFSLKIIKDIKKNNDQKFFCLSRSVIFSIISSVLKIKTIIEVHHELSGLTNKIYTILRKLGYLNNLKYIFTHKNLVKIFKVKNRNYLCLDDAVNIKDFVNYKTKKYKDTCVYIGSFYKGKGVEMILKISRKLSKINFHLYGDKSFLTQKNIPNNVKIYNFINYKDIPKTLSRYDVALMPYANIVSGRLSDINLARSMSPMKMFDYLASGKIILASDLKVYKHILKHNFNSILIGNNSKKWIFWTNKIFKLKKRMKYLGLNAKKTSLKYSWDIRSAKILNFAHKSFFV